MSDEPINFTSDPESLEEQKNTNSGFGFLKILSWLFLSGILLLISVYLYLIYLNKPPVDFPLNEVVVIEKGASVTEITDQLEQNKVIRSSTLLYYTLVLFHEPTSIKASSYIFEKGLTTKEIAERLTEGDFDTDLIKLTHIEGERASQLATRAVEVLPNFDNNNFIAEAEPLEGRLFPDTYLIPPDFDDEQLLDLMLQTFTEKISDLETPINNHNLSLDQMLVLASIIEREANSEVSKKMVSGILQNRLEINMPLQADASIEYILDKPLGELTPADLKIDSPYNTYLNTDLPPTPIGNPGLEAILAVLEPTESEYFYYITGNDGEFYYAETYRQHLINIEKYLR